MVDQSSQPNELPWTLLETLYWSNKIGDFNLTTAQFVVRDNCVIINGYHTDYSSLIAISEFDRQFEPGHYASGIHSVDRSQYNGQSDYESNKLENVWNPKPRRLSMSGWKAFNLISRLLRVKSLGCARSTLLVKALCQTVRLNQIFNSNKMFDWTGRNFRHENVQWVSQTVTHRLSICYPIKPHNLEDLQRSFRWRFGISNGEDLSRTVWLFAVDYQW